MHGSDEAHRLQADSGTSVARLQERPCLPNRRRPVPAPHLTLLLVSSCCGPPGGVAATSTLPGR
eukprot:366209-Chlamydomonas_euryale.AAC.8